MGSVHTGRTEGGSSEPDGGRESVKSEEEEQRTTDHWRRNIVGAPQRGENAQF